MKSNWEETKANSIYHFDTSRMDPRWDTVLGVGKFAGNWEEELKQVVVESKPATWATRGYGGKGVESPDVDQEEYDLTNAGAKADLTICNMSWNPTPTFQKMADLFCLEDLYTRIHVHLTGSVFTNHIDKLQKWCPEDPTKVMRFVIHLNDWQPGQFSQYGNFTHAKWKAGDITTFDWMNVPHCAANASLLPRVVLLVTGIATANTYKFLQQLKEANEVNV
jgi:hypothetical protein